MRIVQESPRRFVVSVVAVFLMLCSAVLLSAQTTTVSFSNTNLITLSAASSNPAAANPYPSTISVTGVTGPITKVTVALNNWSDPNPYNRGFLLVSPSGQAFDFLDDIGTSTISNVTLTLDDAASTSLSSNSAIVSGTFKPSVYLQGNPCDVFLSPAPTGSCAAPTGTATFASVFSGSSANGTWKLYAEDFWSNDSAGSLGGWTLTISYQNVAASTTTTLSSNLNPSFTGGAESSVTLTATVTSGGGTVNSGTVTFYDGSNVIAGAGAATVSNGTATATTTFSTEGAHAIKAVYNPGSGFGTSSGTLTQFVDNHTTGTPPNFCDTGNISINTASQAGPGTPYPQHIYVSGLTGTISEVSLSLPKITHSSPQDLDLLLVGPGGQTFVPLASAGGTAPVSGIDLLLSDFATAQVSGSLSSGTFLPTDAKSNVFFSAPAPIGPYNSAASVGSSSFASVFGGISPNGTWSLYAYDPSTGDTATVGGYCLAFTTTSTASTTTSVSAGANPVFVGNSVSFTAQVQSNGSNVTSGSVIFKDGSTALAGPIALDSNGQATFSTSTLTEGMHTITALYSGVPGSLNVSSGSTTEEVDRQTIVNGNTFCNPGGVTIPANGTTQPYPSRIFVSGLGDTVKNVTISLQNFSHQDPSDARMLLTGPTGTNLVFWSNAGGTNPISGLNVTLDDAASGLIPSTLASGSYQPTAAATVAFPSPAPGTLNFAAPTGSATLSSTFSGTDPNGTWSLYAVDGSTQSGGTLGEWCLNFTENVPVQTVVTNVTSTTANGTYSVGSNINVSVTFSNPVTVTGTPLLVLNSGGTASYAGGSGTSTLTFVYSVAAGQNSSHLDYTSSAALTLNGGDINDNVGNAANLTLAAPGAAGSLGANKSIVIDTTAPTAVAYNVLFGSDSYNLIGSVRNRLPWQISAISVVFSKPIASATVSSLTGVSATGLSGLGTNTLTWTLSPLSLGSFSTALSGSGPNAIRDSAGNALNGGAGYAQNFKVLVGDFNDDGYVSSADMVDVNNARSQPYNIFADINGDGVVNITDVSIVRFKIGTSLP